MWIDEDQAEIKEMELKEISINMDLQRGIKKQRWIEIRQKQIQACIRRIDRHKENGFERYSREFALIKRQKEIDINLD